MCCLLAHLFIYAGSILRISASNNLPNVGWTGICKDSKKVKKYLSVRRRTGSCIETWSSRFRGEAQFIENEEEKEDEEKEVVQERSILRIFWSFQKKNIPKNFIYVHLSVSRLQIKLKLFWCWKYFPSNANILIFHLLYDDVIFKSIL